MENIVYIAAPRDWFDYLTTGATLLLSAIAVIIAVSTARQQNKIALFEKRFEVLKMVNKVKQFADAISTFDLSEVKIRVVDILSIWVTLQRLDLSLHELLSFMPESICDQAEEKNYEPDIDTIIYDTEVMRKQLTIDVNILLQGCPLFPEPLRTGVEQLKINYSLFLISLLEDYGGASFSSETKARFKQFISSSEEFAIGQKLERIMVGCVKI